MIHYRIRGLGHTEGADTHGEHGCTQHSLSSSLKPHTSQVGKTRKGGGTPSELRLVNRQTLGRKWLMVALPSPYCQREGRHGSQGSRVIHGDGCLSGQASQKGLTAWKTERQSSPNLLVYFSKDYNFQGGNYESIQVSRTGGRKPVITLATVITATSQGLH